MGNRMNRTVAELPELFKLLAVKTKKKNRVSVQNDFTLSIINVIHFSFIYLKYNNILSAFVLHPATTPICPIILSASAAVLFKGKHIGVNLPATNIRLLHSRGGREKVNLRTYTIVEAEQCYIVRILRLIIVGMHQNAYNIKNIRLSTVRSIRGAILRAGDVVAYTHLKSIKIILKMV